MTHPKKHVRYVNSLKLLRVLGLEPETTPTSPRLSDCTSSPGQICTTCQQWTLHVLTSPSATPFWIILFSVPTFPPTLWEWARNRDMGQTGLLEEKHTTWLFQISISTLKSSINTGCNSSLTTNHSRNFNGEYGERALVLGKRSLPST